MYSFYGGRPGTSFVISARFSSIQEMVNKFKLGADYSGVHYDEYVLINTEDKSNRQNGRIYRRGYEYTNDMGGAEYIGTIAGPMGPAPALIPTSYIHISNDQSLQKPTAIVYDSNSSQEFKPSGFRYTGALTDEAIIDDINSQSQEERAEYALKTFGIEKYLMWKYGTQHPGLEQAVDNEKTIVTEGAWTVGNGGLVPGNQWKSISWKAASFTDANNDETNGYFSVRVPYPVIDFEVQKKNIDFNNEEPYIENITATSTLQVPDPENPSQTITVSAAGYPFYEKWKLSLPIVYPINVTNSRWQGVGKLYDAGNGNESIVVENPNSKYKRLYFTIPLNAPISSKANFIQITGTLYADSLGIQEIRDTSNFEENPTSYFSLNSSVLNNVTFFKTVNVNNYNNVYLKSSLSLDNNDHIIYPAENVGTIGNIYKNSFGLCVDLYTNLLNSDTGQNPQRKTDFVLIRFLNLSLRFYENDPTSNPPAKDIYENNSLTDLQAFNYINGE